MSKFISNYIARHQNRANQLLHLVGVPLAFGVSVHWFVYVGWQMALGAFVGGYVLQFVGHAIEGNDPGELILIKKLFGQSYREFGPGTPEGQLEEQSKSAG